MSGQDREILGELVEKRVRTEITGISIDSRTIREGELFIAIKGDRFDGHDFVPEVIGKGAWGAVVDRAVLDEKYARLGGLRNIVPVEDTLFALQEMAHLHRKKFTIPVVGITGSNGKTTTKEMLAGILKQKGLVLKNEGNLNNHIGVPLTLLRMEARHRAAVVEMGMSAAGEIGLLARLAAPDIGVVTNVGPAHLEFLKTLDNVAQAKGELLAHLGPRSTAVLNRDDRYFETLKGKCGCTVLSFGLHPAADVRAAAVAPGRDHMDFRILAPQGSADVRLYAVGMHNVLNALAAAAAALATGMPLETVKFGLDDFTPLAMRSELRQVRGLTVLADCYNANPASMEAALTALVALRAGGSAIAVLGDMLELGREAERLHRDLGRTAARVGIDLLIATGPLAAATTAGAAEGGMPRDRAIEAASPAEAAAILRKRSRPGDAVLVKGSRGMKMERVLEEL